MPQMMINGCQMAFEEHGTGTNTVVFLHDLFFNGRSFNQQVMDLRDRYRCITVDLRGHGQSAGSHTGLSVDTLAQDISQLIAVRRYGRCHLIGAGFGGAVATATALEHPERVASLTLIGSSLGASTAQDKRRLIQRRLQIKLFGMRFVTRALMRRAFSPRFLKERDNRAMVDHFFLEFRKLDRQRMPHAISAYLTRPALVERLHQVSKPALIVAGTEDRVVSADDLTLVHNRLDPSTLYRIERAGHAVHIEKPGAVNSAILDFLRSVPT